MMYNHHLSISFELESMDADAEDITFDQVLRAVSERIRNLKADEILEAVLPPVDSIPVELNTLERFQRFKDSASHWGVCPGHPIEDWKHEIANGDTRLGYWQWAESRIEQEAHDAAAGTKAVQERLV
jgi:hypothetical protein